MYVLLSEHQPIYTSILGVETQLARCNIAVCLFAFLSESLIAELSVVAATERPDKTKRACALL